MSILSRERELEKSIESKLDIIRALGFCLFWALIMLFWCAADYSDTVNSYEAFRKTRYRVNMTIQLSRRLINDQRALSEEVVDE